jgi:N-acetylglucosamine kinase-like BadF-type ATPase
MAGVGRAEDRALIAVWADQVHLAGKVEVTSDAALLPAAGTPEGWGVALIAGTGSMAFARAPDGRTARGGGWGYLLGDEGSGYTLVLAGLQAVMRAADDRGPATSLRDRFLDKLGLREPAELVGAIYQGGRDRPALAALAPVVLEAAAKGDTVANSLVDQAAGELAQTLAAAARKLGLDQGVVPVALAGGLLLASPEYRERVLRAVAALGLQAGPVTLVHEPAQGALRLAMHNINKPDPV